MNGEGKSSLKTVEGCHLNFRSAETKYMSLWAGKGAAREYLEKINENGKVKTPSHTPNTRTHLGSAL